MPRKPKPKVPKVALSLSTAEMLRITGYDRSAFSQFKVQGIIKPLAGNKWDISALETLFKRLRDRARTSESSDKIKDFGAKTAELDFYKAADELCFIKDAEQYWSDGRIAIRQVIERSDLLTPQQKNKLLGEISELKIEPPAPTKE